MGERGEGERGNQGEGEGEKGEGERVVHRRWDGEGVAISSHPHPAVQVASGGRPSGGRGACRGARRLCMCMRVSE